GEADGPLGVELLGGRLLGALADPGEQDGGDDPAPLDVAEPSDRRAGRDGATQLDDPTRAGDRRGGCVALPLILDRGQRDLADGPDLLHPPLPPPPPTHPP